MWCEKFRPISFAVILCKVMEKLIRAQIQYLSEHLILWPAQHGFIKYQLLCSLDEVIRRLDECAEDKVCYLYLRSSDLMSCCLIQTRLEPFGIPRHVFQ